MKNAEWVIKQGKNFADLIYRANGETDNYEIIFGSKIIGKIRIGATLKNPVLTWLDMEHKEPILDEVERKYLAAVIRPFRTDVQYIAKLILFTGDEEIIVSCNYNKLNSVFIFDLPPFEKGTMYKGMEPNQKYTPEELGL